MEISSYATISFRYPPHLAYGKLSSTASPFNSGPKLLFTNRQLPDQLSHTFQLSRTFHITSQGSDFVHLNSSLTAQISSRSKLIPHQQLSSKVEDYGHLLTLLFITISLCPS
ncbi:hypothetical protein F511_09829 [Dorcoceras hygrometricum]|uniref:Uncharacterized protein n=1 Tax=Dorcoceras hygrometricum TaxID=472368 RepID=A0A2Z7CFG4_9LAMI|nr:hypothetical protein F511_09829 [Dorcoceras hygrometricum]